MKRERIRSREGRGILDDALIALASCCAVYSGGRAVNSTEVANLAVVAVLVGTLVSGLIARAARGRRWLTADGFLYLALGLVAYFGARWLNRVFPEDTFDPQLMPSAWLIWMMVFGSFLLWRDSTLLFQAIPPLALFGFVGCYDTFRPVVFFFFAYLVCAATLFARAHSRDMALRAERSGYFGPDLEALRRDNAIVDRLRAGPWRWAAGPDWALGSAAVIVFLSFVGAPVIQQTVKPISGIARLAAPRPRNRQPASVGGSNTSGGQTRIARGPVRFRNIPAFESDVVDQIFFRTESFYDYQSGSWSKGGAGFWSLIQRDRGNPNSPAPSSSSNPTAPFPNESGGKEGDLPGTRYVQREYVLPDGKTVAGAFPDAWRQSEESKAPVPARELTLTWRIAGNAVPIPGQPVLPPYVPARDEVLSSTLQPGAIQTYNFVPPSAPDVNARLAPYHGREGGETDPAVETRSIPTAVVEWAKGAAGAGTIGERTERLRAAISHQISYNINASAAEIPGPDPVERALFDTREGYCDVFASSMVLGARALGIPARYAVGYRADRRSVTPDGKLLLLESDAHAWAELYFAHLGWVPYDATEGAEVVPGGGRRDGPQPGSEFRLPNAKLLLAGVGVLVFLAGIVLLLWPRPKGEKALVKRREAAVGLFSRTVGEARGKPRRLDETLAQHVAATDLLTARPAAEALLATIEADLYAGRSVAPDALEKEVQSFRGELRSAIRVARRAR